MPHIVVEVSPPLLASIQWAPALRALHLELFERGWARLEDLKSRVTPITAELCGEDVHAQQLIATLTLTNQRPPDISAGMKQLVFDHMSRAVEDCSEAFGWVQCCVFLQERSKTQYLKRQWNAPCG
ncbi:hypothetical protein [Comamonas thiooxydans]|uniref:hypothetical protein n=1 Tax=Comamonas thiooxydans TaxID=363952 RepID=UPI0009B8393D|nr:hypothetical protein [Comamonas thiooxydans]